MSKIEIPKARDMRRKLGFTDRDPDTWYRCIPVWEGTTLNIGIDKATGRVETDVLNEHFLQPEYYGAMSEPYRSAIKWTIDAHLHELSRKGLTIPFDHGEYGFEETP